MRSMSTATITRVNSDKNRRNRRASKPVSRVDGAGMPIMEDNGCEYAPKCLTCPWRSCILQLPLNERRVFGLAWRVIESFKAPPDPTIDADGPATYRQARPQP